MSQAREEALKHLVSLRKALNVGAGWYQYSDDKGLDRVVYAGVTRSVTEREEAMEVLRRSVAILEHWRGLLEHPPGRAGSAYLRDRHAVGGDCARLTDGPGPVYAVRYLVAAKRTGATHFYFTALANVLSELAVACLDEGVNPAINGVGEALTACSRELS